MRHLIRELRERAVEPEKWKQWKKQWEHLVGLPKNRNEAWKALQSTRSEAKQAETVQAALLPFEQRFKVNLEQLHKLFGHPAWRNTRFGGKRWKAITELVQSLAASLENGQSDEASNLLAKLSQAQHNTGLIATKLRDLDEALRKLSHPHGV
ncbi:MAG: hypothetical protein AB1555_08030 [Nitrospirota bacterium]